MRRFALQMSRHMKDRRAGIEDHALVRLDQFRAGLPDRFFFGELMGIPRGEHEFVRARIRNPRAAVGSFYAATALQNRQVAPNGRNRGANLSRQFLQRGEFDLLEVLLDARLTFLKLHWHG